MDALVVLRCPGAIMWLSGGLVAYMYHHRCLLLRLVLAAFVLDVLCSSYDFSRLSSAPSIGKTHISCSVDTDFSRDWRFGHSLPGVVKPRSLCGFATRIGHF